MSNNCESTNELINRVAYDIIINTGMWGLIIFTSLFPTKKTYNELLNQEKEDKLNIMRVGLQLAGIFGTSMSALKYYSH